jgi:SAM-dependent methyltransferase
MMVIDQWCPNWRNVVIHESSPERRGTSVKLARECAQYVPSQFFPGKPLGSLVDGVRNENFEQLTFAEASIDLHISQDVFEHVLDPDAAFREIARTLRPGGMHIFTVPIVRKMEPSRTRARMEDGVIRNLLPEEFHGNPVGDGRSLVTTDWGYDICCRIFEASGLFTHVIHRDDMEHGIRAEYLEVLVTVKPT